MSINNIKVASFCHQRNTVGVRNLIKKRQKYLFRSILTNRKATHGWLFLLAVALVASSIAPQGEAAADQVRISRPKVGELAHQTQGAEIFARSANTLVPQGGFSI